MGCSIRLDSSELDPVFLSCAQKETHRQLKKQVIKKRNKQVRRKSGSIKERASILVNEKEEWFYQRASILVNDKGYIRIR